MGVEMKIGQSKNISGSELTRRLCWILVMMFSVFAAEMFSKDWNGIIPCVSTRLEAEKILGKDNFPIEIGTYRYKKFRVHVRYERKDEK